MVNGSLRRTGRTTKMLTEVINFMVSNTNPDGNEVNIVVLFHNHNYTRDMFRYKFKEMLDLAGCLGLGKFNHVESYFQIENVRVFFKSSVRPIRCYEDLIDPRYRFPWCWGLREPILLFEDHYIYDLEKF